MELEQEWVTRDRGRDHSDEAPMSSVGNPANASTSATHGNWGTPNGLTAIPICNPAAGEFRHPSVRQLGLKYLFPKEGDVALGSVQEGLDMPHTLSAALGRPQRCCFATRFLMAFLIFLRHLREWDSSRDHEEAEAHFSSVVLPDEQLAILWSQTPPVTLG